MDKNENCSLSEIWIGGTITRELVPGLVEALHKDGATGKSGHIFIPADASEAILLGYMNGNCWLNFNCAQPPNGTFYWTELFCKKHGISFNSVWDSDLIGMDAYGDRKTFRPGFPVHEQTVNAIGEEVISGEMVREAIAKLNSYSSFSTWVDGERDEDLYNEGMRILKDTCPAFLPVLGVFSIVA